MAFTPNNDTPLAETPPPPEFDLWMLAALGCLPITLLLLLVPDTPGEMRAVFLLFIAGIVIHCLVRWRRGRPLGTVAYTGAWLLPATALVANVFLNPHQVPDVLCSTIGTSLLGLAAGAVIAKQFEAALVIGSLLQRRMRAEPRLDASLQAVRERLDEESTPLEVPPQLGIPRRFGVRGLLIATTWAAVLMGLLRTCRVDANVYFMVVVFVGGALAAQIFLFRGRSPVFASAWCGAFLLPIQALALSLYWNPRALFDGPMESIALGASLLAVLVPVGIAFGAIAGFVGGVIYHNSEEILICLSSGVPEIALEPIADADADVLLRWIIGPKLCQRWAGTQFTWPLDRKQLLDRFATAQGEQPTRRIFKAVDIRTGNMLAYVELDRIDYRSHYAWLELPLVDSDASERGRLSVALLRALAKEAFGKLGLFSVLVAASADQSEVASCCDEAWQRDYHYHPLLTKPGARWTAVYRKPPFEH